MNGSDLPKSAGGTGAAPAPASATPGQAIPRHVAIIMDGNGRWAAQRGLPRVAGHERGTDNIRPITYAAGDLGIKYLTLWAFSTENWRRPAEEIEGIMRILGEVIQRETAELHRQGAQLRHIGRLEGLSPDLQQAVRDAIELTKNNDKLVLTLAFNYGGRQEMVHAIRQIVASGIAPNDITDEVVQSFLYTHDLPDPDLIIRTSGEYRMSNFLLWQSAYAELFFSPLFWPDFGADELREAVRNFGHRERRFGHVSATAAAMLEHP